MPPERPDVDPASVDVWQALARAEALEDALEAALRVLRGGRLLRVHAFIALVERITDHGVLYELATIALDEWPPQPYLTAVCIRLAALSDHRLWSWIFERRERLAAKPSTAVCAAVILATSNPGSVTVLRDGLDRLTDVPMFAVVAHLITLPGHEAAHEPLVREAMEHCIPDRTGAYLLARALHDLLRNRELEKFAAQYAMRGGLLVPVSADHPIVLYIDAARHVETSASEPGFATLAHRLFLADQFIVDCARIFAVFAKLVALPRGDRAAPGLYLEMTRAYPSSLPELQPVWQELVNARLTWSQRTYLEFFG